MSIRLDTPFEAFDFDITEEEAAKVLSFLQTQHVRTQLSAVATEKVKVDLSGDLHKVDLHLAYLQGRIESYESLIAISEDFKSSKERINDERIAEGANRPWHVEARQREDNALREAFSPTEPNS